MTKEELRKEFKDWYNNVESNPHMDWRDELFEWFWKRLEEKERQLGLLEIDRNNKAILLEACESALRGRDELLKAADKVISIWDESAKNNFKYNHDRSDRLYKALEKYNSLKSNP